MPEVIPVCDEADALLTQLALQTRLGRGRLLELAIEYLGEAVVTGVPEILTRIEAKREARDFREIAKDVIEIGLLSEGK